MTKVLCMVLLELKKMGELYATYKEQIQLTRDSDNPGIGMLMKSLGDDASIKEIMTDEAIEGIVNSMLGE